MLSPPIHGEKLVSRLIAYVDLDPAFGKRCPNFRQILLLLQISLNDAVFSFQKFLRDPLLQAYARQTEQDSWNPAAS